MLSRYLSSAALIVLAVTAMGCTLTEKRAIAHYDGIPAGAYAIVAEVRAKPGKEDELRAATLPLIADVRREPNNLLYFLQEDREAKGRFVFYEIFASKADFDAHNATSHVQGWFAKISALTEGSVKVTRLEILEN